MPAQTPARMPRSVSRYSRNGLLLLLGKVIVSASCGHAPARRLAVEHVVEGLDARLHAARALPDLRQRLLVLARQPPRRAPPRGVVGDDPDRRDDEQEDDAEDKHFRAAHHAAPLPCGFGLMRLPRRSFNAFSSSAAPFSASRPASSSPSVGLRPRSNASTLPSISSRARSTCSKRANASVMRSS